MGYALQRLYPAGKGNGPKRVVFFDGKRWRKETVDFAPNIRAARKIIKTHFPAAVDIEFACQKKES